MTLTLEWMLPNVTPSYSLIIVYMSIPLPTAKALQRPPSRSLLCRGSNFQNKASLRVHEFYVGRVCNATWAVQRAARDPLHQQSHASILAVSHHQTPRPLTCFRNTSLPRPLPSTASFLVNKTVNTCLPAPHIFGSHAMTSGVLHDSQSIAPNLRLINHVVGVFTRTTPAAAPLQYKGALFFTYPPSCRYSNTGRGWGVPLLVSFILRA